MYKSPPIDPFPAGINNNCNQGDDTLARTNYSFNKRQKELAKKKKKELKKQRKLEKKAIDSEENPDQDQTVGEADAEA